MKRRPERLFIVAGTALWLVVTCVGLIQVIEAPAEHRDLAAGLLAIWIVLLVLALVGPRITEHPG